MQPGAIIAAAIEILDEQASNPGPLDLILQRYVRARRYIGSKDRSALGDHVFGAVRRQGRLDWRLRAAGAEPGPRARILADAVLTGGASMYDLSAMTADAQYGPPPLTTDELGWLAALGAIRHLPVRACRFRQNLNAQIGRGPDSTLPLVTMPPMSWPPSVNLPRSILGSTP